MRIEISEFSKKLITLILPIAFQQFMLALVSASDAVMLGMLRQDALSAVSLAGQITFVENLFFAAVTIGLSMFAAQYWGKKDKASVEKLFAYAMRITAMVSFIFFIAGIFCAGGDSKFGFLCDTITMWCITVPLGMIAAFVLKLPVLVVYFIVNLDEIVKLPAVYRHYKKYKWVKDLTIKTEV